MILTFPETLIRELSPYILEESINCGAIWINIGDNHGSMHIISGRFVIYRAFLYQYQDLFDRVIFTDMFDTFFQQDPFGVRFDSHYFRPTMEGLIINQQWNNKMWVSHIDRSYSRMFYNDKYVINAGFLYGGIDHAFRFFDVYINLTYWFAATPNDQGLINYQHYKLDLYDGSFKVDSQVDNLISCCGWKFENFPRDDDLMYIDNENDDHKAPTGLHEYNRYCPLNRYIMERCPPLGPWDRNPYGKPTGLFQNC